MRLRRIELEQVRKFQAPVAVEPIADGLNLIVGANEAGKSTLLAALHAVLFLKHGSSRAGDLQHHRDKTAPRVALDLEIGGERLHFEKRFLQRPQAVLQVGGARLTGDAAEQAFQDRLAGGARGGISPGLWTLLLVGQGQSLGYGVAPDARGTIQASLEAQLDSVTGGAGAKDLIGRLEDRLFGQKGLIHKKNRQPKGRFKELDQKLADLDGRLAELEARRGQLASDVASLEGLLREQAAGPDPARELDLEIRRLEAAESALVRRTEAATAAARAALALHEAEAARDARSDLVRRRDETAAAVHTLDAAAARTAAERDAALAAGEALAAAAKRGDALLEAAKAWLGAAEEAERVRAAAAAGATEVAFDLMEAAPARVRLDGSVPGSRRFRVKVSEQLTIDLAGIGRIGVRPAQADGLAQALRAIEARAAAARSEIERMDRAAVPDVSDRTAFRAGLARLEQERADLERRLEDARAAFREARAEALRADRDRDERRDLLEALERELAAARAAVPDAALDAAVAATGGPAPTSPAPEAGPDDAPDLGTVRERLHALRAEREAARQRGSALDVRIAGLSERVALMQGRGLGEEIEERLRERSHLLEERAAMAREVEVLSLLRDTLAAAEREVRERYTAPLVARLQPALDELLPGAEVRLDDDLQIRAVIRADAGEEDFAQLSHGTREQLAVVARLAFAELLVDAGQPCFVVLDDALVFSDDARLERMFRILERAGEKVQVLVLTCRERAFGSLRATRLRIEAVREGALA